MARTVAEAISSARGTLNDRDTAGLRTSDADLVGFATDALNMMRNIRPDLFVGQWGSLTVTTVSALPIDEQFFRPVVDYLIARAEMADDEHVNSGRAQLMAQLSGGFLK